MSISKTFLESILEFLDIFSPHVILLHHNVNIYAFDQKSQSSKQSLDMVMGSCPSYLPF